jgi:hypothetical protein
MLRSTIRQLSLAIDASKRMTAMAAGMTAMVEDIRALRAIAQNNGRRQYKQC